MNTFTQPLAPWACSVQNPLVLGYKTDFLCTPSMVCFLWLNQQASVKLTRIWEHTTGRTTKHKFTPVLPEAFFIKCSQSSKKYPCLNNIHFIRPPGWLSKRDLTTILSLKSWLYRLQGASLFLENPLGRMQKKINKCSGSQHHYLLVTHIVTLASLLVLYCSPRIFKEKRDCLRAMVVVMTVFERFYLSIWGRGVLEIAKAIK